MNTLQEIEQCPAEILTLNDIYPYLKTDPNTLREQAVYDPSKLGFPIMVMKSRIKVSKYAFVHAMKYGWVPNSLELERYRQVGTLEDFIAYRKTGLTPEEVQYLRKLYGQFNRLGKSFESLQQDRR